MSNLNFLLSTKWIIDSESETPFDYISENIKYLLFNLDGSYTLNDKYSVHTFPLEEYGGTIVRNHNLSKWFPFDEKIYLNIGQTNGYCIVIIDKQNTELNFQYISVNKEVLYFKASQATNYLCPENFTKSIDILLNSQIYRIHFLKEYYSTHFIIFTQTRKAIILTLKRLEDLISDGYIDNEDCFVLEDYYKDEKAGVIISLYNIDSDKIILLNRKDYSVIGTIEIDDDLKMVGNLTLSKNRITDWNISRIFPMSKDEINNL